MNENIYDQLKNERKPRVHIEYEVETEDDVEKRELPFVLGVMGDFSGDPIKTLSPLKQRKFISIDRDNFDQVMTKMNVGLKLAIKDTLNLSDKCIPIQLHFKSIKDFEPDRLIHQIEPLRRLKNARDQLMELLNKSDRFENLEAALEKILQDHTQLKALAKELQTRTCQVKKGLVKE